jgi:signal transduction histidine kinase/DNA-binding response OmpR family regulator
MAADTVLLVAGSAPADADEAARVRATCAELGMAWAVVGEDALAAQLRLPEPGRNAPPVAVLLPSVAAALPLARRLHVAWPDSYLLLVRGQHDLQAFQSSLGIAPMLGRHWALAVDSDAQVASALRRAVASARQRQQLRTTLASANARLSETRSVAVSDYQRLLASEHHLANFLRNSQAAVLGVDGRGCVLFWSEGTAALLGIGARDALGRRLEELGAWAAPLAAAVAGAGSGRELLEFPTMLRGEPRTLEAVLAPTTVDAHGRGTSIVLRDVTARRRAQDQLREANLMLQREVSQRTQELEQSQIALLQAQKLEAIGKLTGGVAHDFNNVLQVIGSNLQLLQPLVRERGDADRLLRAALGAVDRGAKLSSQLLAFARRQPLEPVPLNVGRRVREMDELLRRALGERIEVETSLAGGLWTTLVDGNQLENVILNLAINSRDAMPEGGKLTIEVANVVLDEHYTHDVPDLAPGQYVMLAVSDTGEGMPPEVAAHAFEPFFTTKPEGKGTGLGLSMAYGFAKQSGGHIRIYSEPGHGTTIRLYLPRSYEKELLAPPAAAGPVQGGSETVLVVEDDIAVQAAVVSMLQSLGYRVLRANDAQAALSILQSGVHVDVLFTDVVMPGSLRSPELAQRARHLLPGIAVLFTSGYTQNAIVHGGRLDPGVELLSKPYRQEDLARKIRHVLRDRQPARRPAPAAESAAATPAAGNLRVLLVEDEADLREVSGQMLELLGCSVCSVGSAEAAEAALRSAPFDLMITDISLPGRDGLQLARTARAAHPQLRVVISSGYGQVADAGDLPSLPKPYGLPELQALVEQAQTAPA